jgi:phosphatidylglycerol:prolipoprotein diacylglycerol transferase
MSTLLAEAYLHNLDPFAIQLTPTFGLRWYGLAYAVGFLIAWLFMRWMAKTGRSPLTTAQVGDLMFYAIAGVLVGGRLGHVIFYGQDGVPFKPLWTFTDQLPYWELLSIHKGGMSSHGGMIGVILACCIFARRAKVSSLHLVDLGALSCTAGFFFGRIANFINAELWGKPLPESMQANPPWWSVKYAEEIFLWDPAIPTDAEKIVAVEPLGAVVGGGPAFYERVAEAVRMGNEQVITTLQPLLTAYYPSQLFQSLTDGLLVAVLLVIVWLKPRKPGVVGSWYLIIYGVLRVATEVFRQPDEGVALLLGLSRGQVLSVLMAAAGVVCLMIASRRNVEPLGGFIGKKRV